MQRFLAVIILLTLSFGTGANAAEPIFIGFLEYTKKSAEARIAFSKVGDGWQACQAKCPRFPSLRNVKDCEFTCASEGAWQIIYNEKSFGSLSFSRPKEYKSYKDIGKLDVEGDQPKLPKITARAKDFSGWMGEPPFRPLVLAKNGGSTDPDKWHVSKVNPIVSSSVIKAYRNQFPNINNCSSPDENKPIANYKMPDKNLRMPIVFESRDKDFLVQVTPVGYRCDGVPDEEWLSQLFFIDRMGAVNYLGYGLTPLDAMDSDRDGKSEWFAWFAGSNEDGYVMFFDGMKKNVRYTWTYH